MNAFTNTEQINLGGYLAFGLTNGWGGQVQLSTNAVIDFVDAPAQLHFAASSAMPWTAGALLTIMNWNNSGNVRLFFGTDSSGLNASQLAQVPFVNPGGMSPGPIISRRSFWYW